ncbi:MAG: ribokinase [Limnochordia bacterium]|jgi:ribokinase
MRDTQVKSGILVIGSLNADLVVRVDQLPRRGETLMGNNFARFSGGKGANQAVAAARLGALTYMLGRVGTDLFGEEQLRSLAQSGVDTRAVIRDDQGSTGVAIIAVEEGTGHNSIIVVPGVNAHCDASDIYTHQRLVRQVRVMLTQLEIPLSVVEVAAELARREEALFILDPAPATPLPASLLAKIGVITPNEHEAESLSGVSVRDQAGARAAAVALRAQGVSAVVITLGDRGVFGMNDEEEFVIAAYDVQAVDSVAAGDAFSGALAVALAEGCSLRQSAEFANAAAGLSVTRHGAQPSMPTRQEVEAFVQANR